MNNLDAQHGAPDCPTQSPELGNSRKRVARPGITVLCGLYECYWMKERKKAPGIPPSAATKSMRITSINELKQIMT